jgi:radical SAM superfamily enzyme YgiQ (UPF0313 family)
MRLEVMKSLKEPGQILLISCYELGHQPFGIALPLGFLESAGYRPAALDIAVEEVDPERVRRAAFVGIAVPMHTALRLGVSVAEQVQRLNPDAIICFFGLYASINAAFLLEHVADFVIGGEAERALLELVQMLDQARQKDLNGEENAPVPDLEGVSRRGRIVGPRLERPWNSMQAAVGPMPSRVGLPPLERYALLEHDGQRHVVGYVEASRGCLHRCRHCPIVPVYEGRFFLVPEQIVLADVRAQVAAGARHITFGDADFLNGPGHSLNIVRAMHREFPELTFDFTAKIEHLLKRRTLLRELADSGCLFVISAIESFSELVLHNLAKGHTRQDIFTVLEFLNEVGITLRPSLVAFTPWTSLEDYLDMFSLVNAHDLIEAIDPVQYSVRLLVPPGSALLGESNGETSPIQPFLGPLDQAGFQYPWRHPDPRMDLLHQQVTEVVQQAAQTGEDPALTFERLWRTATERAERRWQTRPESSQRSVQRKPPRMTEPWFCCAEPTTSQLAVVESSRRSHNAFIEEDR